MNGLNILHLYSDENWTGPAESVLNLLKELSKRGHKAFFAGVTKRRGKFLPKIREAGIPVIENLNLDKKSHPLDYFKNLINLSRILKKERIDIIHTHFRYDHILASFIKRRTLLIRTLHRADLEKVNFQERFMLRHKTGHIITISKAIKEKVIRNLGIEPERISTVYGAVDSNKFNPQISGNKIREEFKIDKDAPAVGMIAPLQPYRKHLHLLRTIPQVRKEFPKVKFLLIGSIGSYQKVLKEEIEKLRISDSVIFIGYRDGDYSQVLALLDMEVFLVPGSDGSCRAVLEALAMAKPVVSAKVGPIPEIMKNGREGILINNPDAIDSLARAIIRLLKDRELASKMGNAGRKLMERFTPESRAAQIEEVYNKAIRKPKGRLINQPTNRLPGRPAN